MIKTLTLALTAVFALVVLSGCCSTKKKCCPSQSSCATTGLSK